MKVTIQIVPLNEFEIQAAYKLVPYLRELGRGFVWKHDIGNGLNFYYAIDEAQESKIVVRGQFGYPKLRLAIRGSHVSFSTIGAANPEYLFYDLLHIMTAKDTNLQKILEPDLSLYDDITTNINDYYLVNNDYSGNISEYFQRVIASHEELKFESGLFSVRVAIAGSGDERALLRIKEFSESSLFDEVALALVFCRGQGVPIFYANGGIYYPLSEKSLCEHIQKHFTRVFMKLSCDTGPSEINEIKIVPVDAYY